MARSGDLLVRLRELQETFTPAEKRVANYVQKNLEAVPALSIMQLAAACKTSEASVIRFCRTLGYKGYRDFIVQISTTIGGMEPDTPHGQYTDIQPGDNIATIVSKISYTNIRSIEDTLTVLDRDEVIRAFQLLRKTPRIDFYGVGASGLVCADAVQKFMRINKYCHAYTDGHGILTAAALLQPGDVAVLVSNSGTTMEILSALEVAQLSGASVIAITRYAKSQLAQSADVVLSISTPEITIRSGAMGSRIAMLNVVDILFTGVASAEYDRVKEYLQRTHDVLKERHLK